MKAVLILGLALGAFGFAACGSDDAKPVAAGPTVDVVAQMASARAAGGSPAVTVTAIVAAVQPGAATPPLPTQPAPVPPTPQAPAQFPGDGTFTVGKDIAAGTYRTAGPLPGPVNLCSWERLRGFGGTFAEKIAVNLGAGPLVVTIAPTDAGFETNNCQPWIRQ